LVVKNVALLLSVLRSFLNVDNSNGILVRSEREEMDEELLKNVKELKLII
jgi:hypothetical protein